MSFRSRPVLDRRHRPRWQDELRTQQLTVIAFAVAIALALGIFGATAWNGYWDAHLRPVADVAGTRFDRSDLDQRNRILVAEATAEINELQLQLGGPNDQLIQAQIDQISQSLSDLDSAGAASLVDGAILTSQATEFGVSVSDEEVDAGIAERHTLPELFRARLIVVNALPDDAEAGAEPTEEQREAARDEAQAARERIDGGEDFAAVAAEVSDDVATAASGGEMGVFQPDDARFGEYATALDGAETGDLVGPVEVDAGYAVLELLDHRERTTDGPLRELLPAQGVDDVAYRDFVRQDLLVEAFREHFADEVVVSPAPQRRVAQIFIAAPTAAPVPQERARHVLIQPLADQQDQTAATDEQWEAARVEAEEVRAMLEPEDADWFTIAEERSHDRGSGARGGDLGWYDPNNTGFVEAFTEALADLEVGGLSEPVRSEFGWHVIQKTAERTSPQAHAEELVEQLRDDPESFAEVATRLSEDHETAREGGELGWVARYQLSPDLEDVVFGMSDVDEVSDPVDAGSEGITIFKLLETSDEREIEEDRLAEIRASGFDRWLEAEVREPIQPWLDPQFASSAET
jgi:parvulin-like peptidyl-prolyl isomerase